MAQKSRLIINVHEKHGVTRGFFLQNHHGKGNTPAHMLRMANNIAQVNFAAKRRKEANYWLFFRRTSRLPKSRFQLLYNFAANSGAFLGTNSRIHFVATSNNALTQSGFFPRNVCIINRNHRKILSPLNVTRVPTGCIGAGDLHARARQQLASQPATPNAIRSLAPA